jgi:hypothetical protein
LGSYNYYIAIKEKTTRFIRMKISSRWGKNVLGICTAALVFYLSGCNDAPPTYPPLGTVNSYPNATLTSFDIIKDTYISAAEKKIGMINFNEFSRLYVYNYYPKYSAAAKQKALAKIQEEAGTMKYSTRVSGPRQAPVVMHWTDGDNAMGAIRTLFKPANMAEGVIGVDYVVTEPLKHPDFPGRPAKSYVVNLSKSDVATTWFHTNDQEDRKYNKAINIEITGWRFLKNTRGKTGSFGKNGSLGIRENFHGDFKNLDKNYAIYPTVLKLVNYLAEKNNFASLITGFKPENEIDSKTNKTGTIYLDGPLSQYLKGHGLIALEHTLKYGSKYKDMRHDFTPRELLVLYSDLKGYRQFLAGKPSLKT